MANPTKEQLADPKWWDENAPDGATHIHPPSGEIFKLCGRDVYVWFNRASTWNFTTDSTSLRRSFESAARPTRNPWSGPQDGLPPVESRCEYFDGGEWMPCEVVAHRNNAAIVISDSYETALCALRELRQALTPEQVAANEREEAVKEMGRVISENNSFLTTDLEALYDAGLRFTGEPK